MGAARLESKIHEYEGDKQGFLWAAIGAVEVQYVEVDYTTSDVKLPCLML